MKNYYIEMLASKAKDFIKAIQGDMKMYEEELKKLEENYQKYDSSIYRKIIEDTKVRIKDCKEEEAKVLKILEALQA